MEKKKIFDAVKLVRRIREAHHEQTKDMTKQERLAYYQDKGQQAQRKLSRLAEQLDASRP